MKVLMLCNKAPYPANDGSSIAIYNMANGLVENGIEVHLLTINTKKHFKPDDLVPNQFKKVTNYRSVYHNTDTTLLGALINLFSRQSYFVSRFFFRDYRNALKEILSHHQFDIIQIEGVFMATYIPLIKSLSKAKIVVRTHNIEHKIWDRHIKGRKSDLQRRYLEIQNKRLKEFEIKALQLCDAIVPISQADAVVIKSLSSHQPIYSCITGVDIKVYANASIANKNNNTVFSFGSMDWLPNQEAVRWFISNCWKQVVSEVPHAKLIIAGRSMPLDFFQLNDANIIIEENVTEPASLFCTNTVMIVPLLSGSGIRIKIVEGMAYGTAIVSTSVGAEGINAKNGSDIIIADEPLAFSKAVVSLLTDNELRNRIENNARQFAATNFNNAGLVADLVVFYQNLCNV